MYLEVLTIYAWYWQWSIKCSKHQLVSKQHLFQRKYLNTWLFLFVPRCTLRYQPKCFALTGLDPFKGDQLPLQCRTLGSRCPRVPPGRWESWNFFLCDGFSIENVSCTVSCVRAHQRDFQCKAIKAPLRCFGAWKKSEGTGDTNKNFEAIWDVKDVLVFFFRSSQCCLSQGL